jgi:hypothetical protein
MIHALKSTSTGEVDRHPGNHRQKPVNGMGRGCLRVGAHETNSLSVAVQMTGGVIQVKSLLCV